MVILSSLKFLMCTDVGFTVLHALHKNGWLTQTLVQESGNYADTELFHWKCPWFCTVSVMSCVHQLGLSCCEVLAVFVPIDHIPYAGSTTLSRLENFQVQSVFTGLGLFNVKWMTALLEETKLKAHIKVFHSYYWNWI